LLALFRDCDYTRPAVGPVAGMAGARHAMSPFVSSWPRIDAAFGARKKGGWIVSLLDPSTGLFQYEAFLHLLLRETGRGTRYRDFFTLCIFKPDIPPEDAGFEETIETALSTRVTEFIRSTDIVGRFPTGLAVLLLHTGHAEALGVAERVRAGVRRMEFRRGPDLPPRRLTLSAGIVSFPRDGQTSTTLLSRAQRYLEQARQRGGDKVVYGP
jgi:diguanylate cyclase (GGDEF)-like protein